MLIVERLVPDELWELFQLVVPVAPTRPQGGGRLCHDNALLVGRIFDAEPASTSAENAQAVRQRVRTD